MTPVVLTRAPGDNAALGEALTAAGIPWLEWPAVEFSPIPVDEGALDGVTAVAVVSPTAARMAAALLLPDVPIVAQGAGTAAAVQEHLHREPRVAERPDAIGLADAVIAAVPPSTVAIVRGDKGRDVAAERLDRLGYTVRAVTVYTNRAPADLARPERPVRAVVFASPSAVRRHLRANPWLRDVLAVAIGPTTAAALHDHPKVRVAPEPTTPALLDTLLEVP